MQIKALQAFSYREADGDIFSVALDEIVEMDSTLANGFIADGLAEEYSGGGGGNPNTIQTVTGTLASPWGEINFEELYAAIANKNATATMTIDASALGFGNVIAKLSASNVTENFIYSNGAMFSGDEPNFTVSAFNLSWWRSDGELDMAYMYSNNTINSIKSYANSLPTSLEIIWHPLEATTGA